MGGRGDVAFLRHFRTFGMLAGAIALAIVDARAQARLPAPSPCKAEVFATGKVGAVVDGRSFVLEDGRDIRLAGIEVPFPPAPGETGLRAEAGAAASRASLAALQAIVAGQNVELRQISSYDVGGARDAGQGLRPGRRKNRRENW
jgi:hypothetical protein